MSGAGVRHLGELLPAAAGRWPAAIAVEGPSGERASYGELDRAADRLATRLVRWGVGRGDRVGVWLPGAVEAVAAIHAILRTGAAYVPVDGARPPGWGLGVLAAAHVRAAVVTARAADEVRRGWAGVGPGPRLVTVGGAGAAAYEAIRADGAPTPRLPARCAGDLALVLADGDRDGAPRCLPRTHDQVFELLDGRDGPSEGGRFAPAAPWHHERSVFALFGSCRAGGTLCLGEEGASAVPASGLIAMPGHGTSYRPHAPVGVQADATGAVAAGRHRGR